MMVCRVPYCDFAVWTEKELVVEGITIDSDFHQSMVDAVEHFFVYGVLPKIVGKWYTRKPVANSQGTVSTPSHTPTGVLSLVEDSQNHEDLSMLWCYCNEPVFGDMIMCDNVKCPIKWFHFDCLRIRQAPKCKWYCPYCRKLAQFSRKRTKKAQAQ